MAESLMFQVRVDNDRVLIDLVGRRRDMLLSRPQAADFADALETAAALAEQQPASLYRGEPWEIAFGRARLPGDEECLALRFISPEPGFPDRVPLPAPTARELARRVRAKAEELKPGLQVAHVRDVVLIPSGD